ncbi:hypothetical protein BJV77DRAFT_238691 [Russula vinacea]|nr:hypothetical protein BJV77DRAFT_238691 [Russula vinacea]
MSSACTVNTSARSSGFDKYSFIKYMKNIGRVYRKQATELVSICRSFVQAQDQIFNPDADQDLRVALQAADDALKSASEAGTKTSIEAVDRFRWATEVLHHYEMKWHPRDPSCSKSLAVNERMAAAKAKDGSTSSTLNALKEKLRMQPVPAGWKKPTTVVEFLLFKSLPDARPTLVKREHQLTHATQSLIPYQRCSARVRICPKSFGISAVTLARNAKSVSLSDSTLTSIGASR